MKGEGIGLDAFRVIQKEQVDCAFYGVQIDLPIIIGQVKFAWMGAGDD